MFEKQKLSMCRSLILDLQDFWKLKEKRQQLKQMLVQLNGW